jgi:hypothetical protein
VLGPWCLYRVCESPLPPWSTSDARRSKPMRDTPVIAHPSCMVSMRSPNVQITADAGRLYRMYRLTTRRGVVVGREIQKYGDTVPTDPNARGPCSSTFRATYPWRLSLPNREAPGPSLWVDQGSGERKKAPLLLLPAHPNGPSEMMGTNILSSAFPICAHAFRNIALGLLSTHDFAQLTRFSGARRGSQMNCDGSLPPSVLGQHGGSGSHIDNNL